jgi:hypothetical protein
MTEEVFPVPISTFLILLQGYCGNEIAHVMSCNKLEKHRKICRQVINSNKHTLELKMFFSFQKLI